MARGAVKKQQEKQQEEGEAGSVLPPRRRGAVLGHGAAVEKFCDSFRSGRLHHAWLITGPQGTGKASLAFYLARILLGGEDPKTAASRRISAGTHGDLLHIERRVNPKTGRLRGEIVVDDVREITHFLHHTATESGWRAVIIDGAEYLNRSAANALLKALEEPPPHTILFLTTSSPGRLLPTIRSRCRLLALQPLNLAEMKILFPTMAEAVLKQAQGSPGRVMFLSRDKDGQAASLVQAAMAGEVLTMELWERISRLARENDGFELFCDLLNESLADAAYQDVAAQNLFSAAQFSDKTASLAELRRQTEAFNLDKAQAIRQAFALAGLKG